MRNSKRNQSRGKSIERHLFESQRLDHETYAHLAGAADRIAEAEEVFRRLAEPDLSRT